ncbi:MAG: hypothetical protein ACI9UT_001986, partial [Flavobacteriales bacterium]
RIGVLFFVTNPFRAVNGSHIAECRHVGNI